jgi:hypothetical protein
MGKMDILTWKRENNQFTSIMTSRYSIHVCMYVCIEATALIFWLGSGFLKKSS